MTARIMSVDLDPYRDLIDPPVDPWQHVRPVKPYPAQRHVALAPPLHSTPARYTPSQVLQRRENVRHVLSISALVLVGLVSAVALVTVFNLVALTAQSVR